MLMERFFPLSSYNLKSNITHYTSILTSDRLCREYNSPQVDLHADKTPKRSYDMENTEESRGLTSSVVSVGYPNPFL